MSERWFTHATPTLFNAGTPNPQMSSCFLLQMKEDSIDGIFDTLKSCAQISQSAGGIGLSIHNVRATGSYIRGTGGTSNGIIPMLESSMIQLAILTKVGVSVKALLPSILNRGMPIFLNS